MTERQTPRTTPRIKPLCRECGDTYAAKRAAAGYNLCLPCGEESALRARKSWCVAPMNKSNYMLFTDATLLRQLNPKRTEC